MMLLRRTFALGLLAGFFMTSGCRSKSQSQELIVGAATSMRHVFPALTEAFEKNHPGQHIVVTYGASGEIARQVEAGAGIDMVVFAGKAPLEKLVQSGHVDPSTTKVIGTNELILIGTERSPKLTFATLDTLPDGERLAIGDPKTVPVGQYAREALERLSIWDKLERRVVLGANVAAVLAYVQRGEVAAAIVYRTEVQHLKGIVVLDVAKGSWAPRAEIWAGVVVESHNGAAARDFTHFLTAPTGLGILKSFGFGAP
jgi:molybdate transport system substrate-binding protein